MNIKIGTRGSKLAMTQTNMAISKLISIDPQINAEPVIIKTKGDLIVDRSLDKIGDKGLFVAEIEDQLRQGMIDMAIHSMKDLPTEDSDEFTIFPVLNRADPRDVLVTKHKITSINELPKNCVIGTGSKRRKVQIEKLIPGVQIVSIRGNVETRINKMLKEDMDGTILAAAGLERLQITDSDTYKIIPFSVEEMIPAPAQGVLACQVRRNDSKIHSLVKKLVDYPTSLDTLVERSFLEAVEGGCHIPIGAYLEKNNKTISLHYLYGDEQCKNVVTDTEEIAVVRAEIESKMMERLVRKAKQCAVAAKAVIEK